MTRFLGALVLLAAVVIGLGFYLGWFHVSGQSTGQKSNITISVDQDKIRKDEKKAKDKVNEAGKKVKETIRTETEKSKGEDSRP